MDVLDCTRYWNDDVTRFRPDVVVFLLGDFGDGSYEHDGRWIEPCTRDFDGWYEAALQDGLRTLSATGARVALTTAAYTDGPVGDSRFAKDDCVNDITRTVAAESPHNVLVDLARYVCPTHQCRREEDGVPLRDDGVHYRDKGATLIAGWVLDQIRRNEHS
jgi:hypothetical protein